MSDTAVATPASQGEGAASESSAALGFDSQGALLAAMGLPNRDNSGKAGEATPKPAPAQAGEGEGGAEGKEFAFEFGGRVYKGKTEAEARAAAEHALSVHRGQAKAASKEAARLRTEIEQLKRSAAKPSAAPAATPAAKVTAPATAPDKAAASEDGNLLGLTDNDLSYVKALRAKGEHDQADVYLALKYEEALKAAHGRTKGEIAAAKAELKAEFDALRKPMQDRAEQQEQFNRTVNAFRNRAELLDDAGEAVYPELKDDDSLDEVVDTWSRMVSPVADYPALPPEFATTPAGAHVAYAVWFHETYAPLVRAALAEGHSPTATPAATSAPAHKPAGRGTLTAPVMLPPTAPRREPAPRPPGNSIKDMLTSKNEDNLI